MDKTELNKLLKAVAAGEISPEDAALELKMRPIAEVGEYAKVDMHRHRAHHAPERAENRPRHAHEQGRGGACRQAAANCI